LSPNTSTHFIYHHWFIFTAEYFGHNASLEQLLWCWEAYMTHIFGLSRHGSNEVSMLVARWIPRADALMCGKSESESVAKTTSIHDEAR
jgi:hypothetical protein